MRSFAIIWAGVVDQITTIVSRGSQPRVLGQYFVVIVSKRSDTLFILHRVIHQGVQFEFSGSTLGASIVRVRCEGMRGGVMHPTVGQLFSQLTYSFPLDASHPTQPVRPIITP